MPKLILVANRLPTTVEIHDNTITLNPSVGGLATGMASLSDAYECFWVGFPGVVRESVSREQHLEIEEKLNLQNNFLVWLSQQEVEDFYNGFSNETLWPLFHYFPTRARFEANYWTTYKLVNQKFADEVAKVYEEGDLIWVQDYQLCLVPSLLRNSLPNAKIGFFLHIPFPAFEIFRLLPWRKELLEGLVGANLIGFHTPGYVGHFLDCLRRTLGQESWFGVIRLGGRVLRVDVFPMGIDYVKFSQSTNTPAVKKLMAGYRKNLGDNKILLSIDRLDYTKGISERLNSFKIFLDRYPEYRGKVVWIIVAVPSRIRVESYQLLSSQVNELVGRINGAYGRVDWNPIQYINRGIGFDEICAFYALSDVALVTPVRDGMNLVAKEYVATRQDGQGVLILSEMAGVAEEFGEAVLVNPYDIDLLADKVYEALNMKDKEKKLRMSIMRQILVNHDVKFWAKKFTEVLSSEPLVPHLKTPQRVSSKIQDVFKERYASAQKRVFFLDYDGTLVPFYKRPERNLRLNQPIELFSQLFDSVNLVGQVKKSTDSLRLRFLLKKLASDPKNSIVIISGRKRRSLEQFFKRIKATLVAEHGGWIKTCGTSEWVSLVTRDDSWKDYVRPLLQLYTERTRGSFIEEKDFSLAWHYRNVSARISEERVSELKSNLLNSIANMNLKILEGNKVVEVQYAEITKGRVVAKLVDELSPDFVLVAGDDRTDESMFEKAPKDALTIKIRQDETFADYFQNSHKEFLGFLDFLIK